MAVVRELQANLVLAAGFEFHFDERVASNHAQPAIGESGLAGAGHRGADDVHPTMALVVPEPIDQSVGRWFDQALDQGPICLFRPSGCGTVRSIGRQPLTCGPRAPRGCWRVEPAHYAQIDVARFLIAAFDIFLGQRQERGRSAWGAHRRQARRFWTAPASGCLRRGCRRLMDSLRSLPHIT